MTDKPFRRTPALMRVPLVYILAAVNLAGLAAVAGVHRAGLLVDMFRLDESYMTYAAAGVFVVATFRLFWLATAFERWTAWQDVSRIVVRAARVKAALLQDTANIILTIGLLGTAIGLAIALSAFDPAQLTSPDKLVNVSATLADGMRTAFRSTIVSGFLWVWHVFNLRLFLTRVDYFAAMSEGR